MTSQLVPTTPTTTPVGRTRAPWPAVARAVLRRLWWRTVLFLLGGVTIRGRTPTGPCVVVANHRSHADTAVLLRALKARTAPRVAAAEDYWFSRGPWRRVCSALAAAFPVRRHENGYADLVTRGTALLRAGHTVVVFPEGTRGSHDADEMAGFRRGAFALAESAGVPVVPAALHETGELLPKGGRLSPRPVAVTFGTPQRDADPAAARRAVADLLANRRVRDSRIRQWLVHVLSRWGVVITAVWSFTEALSWPLLPEVLLGVSCVLLPRRAVSWVLTAVVGSVLGGVAALLLYGSTTVTLPQPLTTDRMHTEVARQISTEGAAAVAHQPLSGIPYKIYAAEAGRQDVPVTSFVAESTTARGHRMLTVGVFAAAVGFVGQRLRRFTLVYLVALSALFVTVLTLAIGQWT